MTLRRNSSAVRSGIGVAKVREWSKTLPRGSSVLELGCGAGVPISQTLIEEGFELYGIDASPKHIAAFRERFPNARAQCAAIEESGFLRTHVRCGVAWGLMFLLQPEEQRAAIRHVARALNPAGRFLFTSPRDAVLWKDSLRNVNHDRSDTKNTNASC